MLKVALLCVGITLVAVLGFMINAQSRTPTIRPVDHSKQQCTIFALGRIEGATPEIELRPRLTGRIVELLVQEGQFVEEGEVLLRLDDARYRHEVALATAELHLAEAQLERLLNGAHFQERTEAAALHRAKAAELERAQISWKRIDELRQARAISQQEADNQRTQVDALTAEVEAAKARLERVEASARPDEVQIAQARIQAAEARLELAKVQMERTNLRAPGRGQILKIDVQLGELTGPTSVEPAVVMADTTKFHVRTFVEEMDAPRVKVGMTAKILADGLPGQELKGRVTHLSPRMGHKQLWSDRPDERYDTKMREVWIELEKGTGLVMGLRVDVMIDPGSLVPGSTETARSSASGTSSESLPGLRLVSELGPAER